MHSKQQLVLLEEFLKWEWSAGRSRVASWLSHCGKVVKEARMEALKIQDMKSGTDYMESVENYTTNSKKNMVAAYAGIYKRKFLVDHSTIRMSNSTGNLREKERMSTSVPKLWEERHSGLLNSFVKRANIVRKIIKTQGAHKMGIIDLKETVKLSMESTFIKPYSRRGKKGCISDRGDSVGNMEHRMRRGNIHLVSPETGRDLYLLDYELERIFLIRLCTV